MTGLGRKAWARVGCLEGREAIDPTALEKALAGSDAAHKIVAASAGTVTATDFDDLDAVADICNRHGAWLHVDGTCLPVLRYVFPKDLRFYTQKCIFLWFWPWNVRFAW